MSACRTAETAECRISGLALLSFIKVYNYNICGLKYSSIIDRVDHIPSACVCFDVLSRLTEDDHDAVNLLTQLPKLGMFNPSTVAALYVMVFVKTNDLTVSEIIGWGH